MAPSNPPNTPARTAACRIESFGWNELGPSSHSSPSDSLATVVTLPPTRSRASVTSTRRASPPCRVTSACDGGEQAASKRRRRLGGGGGRGRRSKQGGSCPCVRASYEPRTQAQLGEGNNGEAQLKVASAGAAAHLSGGEARDAGADHHGIEDAAVVANSRWCTCRGSRGRLGSLDAQRRAPLARALGSGTLGLRGQATRIGRQGRGRGRLAPSGLRRAGRRRCLRS